MAETEYETFQELTDALDKAARAAARMTRFRSDQDWAKISQGLWASREMIFQLAGSGVIKGRP